MNELLTYQAQSTGQQAETLKVLPGKSSPLGATVYPHGVNFCIFSQNAEAIELLLFDTAEASRPVQIIKLDPSLNKTYYYWHIFVPRIKAGQIYAYRAYGQFAPEKGYRFDPTKVLLDPYARAIVNTERYDRISASRPGDNCARALKGVVVDTSTYDWEGDLPPRIPYSTSVIYELHVGGFTRHPNSGVSPEKRGTYAGIIDKIPYLQELGITAVELLPVHQFDSQDVRPGMNILSRIESDPVLAGTKLIAEAWDAAGLYGVGKFVELADWVAEWNGPFRDDVRRFVKGDRGKVNRLAARILASPDIYSRSDTDINRSVNFITCHDGFTLF